MFGPAKMPKELVARLNREFLEILKEPDVIETLGKQGFVLTPSTPEALAKFLGEQIEAWKVSARAAGIEPE
jgi:tripartite-type tricarboxylate transporter receptor subunit TctC